MCVMCVSLSADERPTRKELEKSCVANPDGFGWAVLFIRDIDGQRAVFSGKSMKSKTAIHDYFDALNKLGDRVIGHLFHARIATRGSVSTKGCHPFEINDGSGSYMAHNGILSFPMDKMDLRVDSQIFAEDVLPAYGGVKALANGIHWAIMDGYVSEEMSKIAILSTDNDTEPVMILGEQLGHWQKTNGKLTGLWWSNYSYTGTTKYTSSFEDDDSWYEYEKRVNPFGTGSTAGPVKYDRFEPVEYILCPNTGCGERVPDTMANCPTCGYCMDCWDAWEKCMCYSGDQPMGQVIALGAPTATP